MKYLLDTHTVLWLTSNPDFLTGKVKDEILNPQNIKYVSIASAWELAIKMNIGKFRLNGGISEFYKMVEDNGFVWLNLKKDYISILQNLEHHHKDPFDRLLISTAISEQMTIISADENIRLYNVNWIW